MILFTQLGNKGRFGNQLFQIASVIGLAKRNNAEYMLPPWQYKEYFKAGWMEGPFAGSKVKEPAFHYDAAFWEKLGPVLKEGWIDLDGYLQSEKYWIDNKQAVLDAFTFEESFLERMKLRMPDNGKRNIAISIRRGDYMVNVHGYVGNPNYEQLPITHYIQVLYQIMPWWRDCNLLFFSDDLQYCRVHFQCLPNAYFMEGSDVEQLCMGTQADHFIIANSTFSWWMAYLGQKRHSIVVRPARNFDGPLARTCNEKDFWPENWTSFDWKSAPKLDLSDVTFIVPVSFDHKDRLENFTLSMNQLLSLYNTNIIVGEMLTDHFSFSRGYARYIKFPYEEFHRTKALNQMTHMSTTPYIVNWDADIFVPPMQVLEGINLLRSGVDVVYPYDGRFARVGRGWKSTLERIGDVGVLTGDYRGTHADDKQSVGGAVMVERNAFIEVGMENENFISYGPEDTERWIRFHKLGLDVRRVGGVLYHLDHYIGINSSHELNPYIVINRNYLLRTQEASQEELVTMIQSWPWRTQYSSEYHKEISESAIESSKIVYSILKYLNIPMKSILDIGCGIGQWGVHAPNHYVGVDYSVKPSDWLLPESPYYHWDITGKREFPVTGTFDLVLCLEVAEHVPEKYAENLVELLSKYPYVLFSAAIPGQGGEHHYNEQWQSWWAEKFRKAGLYPSPKPIRELLADQKNVAVWYRQNMVLYSSKFESGTKVTDYIDPEMFTNIITTLKP